MSTQVKTGEFGSGKESITRRVKAYAKPELSRSVLNVALSALPFFFGVVGLCLALQNGVPYPFVLAGCVPVSGFAVRTFIVFHDAGHGSLFASKAANKWVGRVTGVMTFNSFGSWTHNHAIHHATTGDLDRRGSGDIPTLTVAEYYEGMGRFKRIGYRIFRHPLVLFTVVPIYVLLIDPRIPGRGDRRRIKNSVHLNNLALAAFVGLQIWSFGLVTYLAVILPVTILTATIGLWLFFVQHQFEDAYWEAHEDWDFAQAALHGSSYLKLPRLLQFFTGNIGFHHVHHLSAKIPNYKLQKAHDENEDLQIAPTLTLLAAFKTMNLALWDEEGRKLISFKAAAQLQAMRLISGPTLGTSS